VVLVEQFEPGHDRGSSHGSTRIFRLAYPDPAYVEMARRALLLWRELEGETGEELLVTTGGIDYGERSSVQPVVETLVDLRVPHEILGPVEAARHWPGFLFDGPVVHQPDAGRIAADTVVRVLQEDARSHGAQLHFREPVQVLAPDGDRVLVASDAEQYRAKAAVVTAGAWVVDLLAGVVDLPALRITREQVFHFPTQVADDSWPSFIFHGPTTVYGLHAPGDEGVKVAEHHAGADTTAGTRSFDIDPAGRQRVVQYVATRMPGLRPLPRSETTCLYTNTPDTSFVIERHGRIVVGSACSGHGFKFAPLIGRRLAELAGSIR
jgi:monomeric sarcosine oxidase